MKLSVLRSRRDPAAAGAPAPASEEERPSWWQWLPLPTWRGLRDDLRRNPGLKLVSLAIATMLWATINVTERDAERLVELPISLWRLQPGLIVTNPPVKPVAITLRGPRTILDGVDEHKARLRVDLSGAQPGDVRSELNVDMFRPDLPRRLKVVRMEPARIKIHVDRLVRRTMPVRADLAGTPALGYTVAESTVVPDHVEVSGPAGKIDELKEITTEPIDLRGMKDNVERTVLVGWAGDFVGFVPDHVMVTVRFEEVMVSREFRRVDVRILHGDDVKTSLTPSYADVSVRGPQRVLVNFKLEDGAVYVDANGLPPGTHEVPVRVDLAPSLELVHVQPEMHRLTITAGSGR